MTRHEYAILITMAGLALTAARAAGQSNSLFLQAGQAQQQAQPAPRHEPWPTASVPLQYGVVRQENAALQAHSFTAVELPPPRVFRVHDLVTVIIREQKKYKSDAELESDKKWDIGATLNQWFRITDGKWHQQQFPNGKPQVDANVTGKLSGSGTTEREDELITRITVEIADIKPNGTLVLKGHKTIKTDEEEQDLLLTGVCRSEDVGPDNTILSTQVHDLRIDSQHKGAVRDASRRGWIPKLLDKVRPF